MSGVNSPSIERAEYSVQAENIRVRWHLQMPRRLVERRMLQGLADKMVAQTQVHVEVRDAVRLDDPQLLQVPFVLMTVNTPFEFTGQRGGQFWGVFDRRWLPVCGYCQPFVVQCEL